MSNDITITDPRPTLDRALTTALSVVDRVTPDQLHLPTPCDGFDVDQLIGHLAFALVRVAACGRGEALGAADEVFTSTDWSRALRVAATEAIEAWADDARLTAPIELPWRTMTGAEAVGVYANEVTVHTWDLATATGQTVEWDEDVVAACRRSIEAELPMADRDPMWAAFVEGMPAGTDFAPPFANAQPVADDAAPIAHLVAWNGRRPAA